jgi:DNA polymerase-3 subunit alpha
LRDCIIKENELIDYALELGHKAVAITDHDSISNAVKVEKYYKKIKNQIYRIKTGTLLISKRTK